MQSLTHKHIASLSALMMFAPLISYQIDNFGLDDEAKRFVWSYIRIWYIVIAMVVMSMIISLAGNYLDIDYTTWISTWCMCIALCIMIVGILMILQNNTRWQVSATSDQHLSSTTPTLDTIIDLIPGYNLYQRYQGKHDYIIQESIILWTLYAIVLAILPNLWIALLGLMCVMSVNVLHIAYPISVNWRSQRVQKSFVVNIEEIYGRCVWVISYYSRILWSHIFPTLSTWTLQDSIHIHQSTYQTLSPLQGNHRLMAEYIILGIIIAISLIWYISQDHYQIWSRIIIIPSLIITIRYLLMFYINQFVSIPVIHEWVWLISLILTFFIHHKPSDDQTPLT